MASIVGKLLYSSEKCSPSMNINVYNFIYILKTGEKNMGMIEMDTLKYFPMKLYDRGVKQGSIYGSFIYVSRFWAVFLISPFPFQWTGKTDSFIHFKCCRYSSQNATLWGALWGILQEAAGSQIHTLVAKIPQPERQQKQI